MDLDQYTNARDALIDKDLIAFDGTVFQVLELPTKPVVTTSKNQASQKQADNRAAICRLVEQTLKRI
jgi:hypothetical protein